jgi:iron(II)-dependent oxidoreductase
VDDVERLGEGWREFAAGVVALLDAHPSLRVLMLGDALRMDGWPLPAGLARHALLPLPEPERRDALAARGMRLGRAAALDPAAGHPGIFGLALRVDAPASGVEAIVDAWRAAAGRDERDAALARPWLADLLAAAELAVMPDPGPALAAFARDPEAAAPVLASLLSRWSGDRARGEALVAGLLDMPGDGGHRGALCAAAFAEAFPGMRARLRGALVAIVEAGALRPAERVAAGRALSRLGDPRDLEALVDVPGGSFAMGCATNPNSSPPHRAAVEAFRIGAYPVTNARYGAFVAATGRAWAMACARSAPTCRRRTSPGTTRAPSATGWARPGAARDASPRARSCACPPSANGSAPRAATSPCRRRASCIPGASPGTTIAPMARRRG